VGKWFVFDKARGQIVSEEEKEGRPKKGLEDWEMLQPRDEKPLRIPYWLIVSVAGLFITAVLLTFPFFGEREGYERSWFDSGLLVGVGYGVVILIAIYFLLRRSKKSKDK